jgi:hypothetical protein
MANKNFPGPNINRLIDKDPQIVKIDLDQFQWGTRQSLWKHMSNDPKGADPGQPSAPEMTIKHTGS